MSNEYPDRIAALKLHAVPTPPKWTWRGCCRAD